LEKITILSADQKTAPQARKNILRWIVYALALFGLLVLLVTISPIDTFLGRKLAGPWNDPKGDVLIVLGAGAENANVLDHTSYLRARYALEAYREGGFQKILISAGGNLPVAPAMADFLVCHGVPQQAILIDEHPASTHENALSSSAMLKDVPGTRVLLTSDYHMFRAHRAFEKAGVHILPRPFPDVLKKASGWRGRWSGFLDISEEMAKIAYYRARGWM
jgi:uncharacterized SAM-binding protein YcdF (DUF218 family)